MFPFVDREEELDFLEREYRREGASLVILYGRRRVGKTALASKFMKGKPALYVLVTEESERQNRAAFKDAVAEFCGNELLKGANVDDWGLIFRAFCEGPNERSEGKKLLILDEFQYLGRSNPAFPSVFQKIWDTYLRGQNIMAILCGSLISMMEGQTLHYSSPLYGRRTGQIRLGQIPFACYHEFFPGRPRRELVERYAVTGGVPKYIELFHDAPDVYSAIEQCVLSRSSFLAERIRENFIDGHVSYVYEDVCVQELRRLCAHGRFPFDRVGRWWDNSDEIDIVALDSQGGRDIAFGECKFWGRPAGVNVLTALQAKARTVRWGGEDRRERFLLFSIGGFTDDLRALAADREDIVLME